MWAQVRPAPLGLQCWPTPVSSQAKEKRAVSLPRRLPVCTPHLHTLWPGAHSGKHPHEVLGPPPLLGCSPCLSPAAWLPGCLLASLSLSSCGHVPWFCLSSIF